jgi:hypothetical protein
MVSNTLLVKVLLAAVACIFLWFGVRATDIDTRALLFVAWSAFGLGAIILP